MMRLLTNPRHLLPLMVIMGVIIMGMRIEDMWTAAETGHLFASGASAETTGDAKPADAKPDTKPDTPPVVTPPILAGAAPDPAKTPDAPKAADPGTAPSGAPAADEDVSPAEMEVLKQLSARREELDKRAKELDTRESLLKVAEQRVDQKIKEMETLRAQLQAMVDQLSGAQSAQLDNLVKMYETMKPEDAAKIFDTLDMPVLLNVVRHMKPKSVAPIMAKMSSEKAKDVTVALSKQDQLPKIK